jgi:hypothetical protein
MLRVAIYRSIIGALIVALALLFLQPGSAGAAGATLNLNTTAGPAGTMVTATGSGFGNNLPVTIYFNNQAIASTTSSGTGTINTTFTVPTVVAGPYPVFAASTGTGGASSNTVTFTVGPTTGTFVAAKFVTVNGLGYSTVGHALPGSTLTYQIQVTNTTGNNLAVTATDVLAPGQTVLAPPGFPCTFIATNTLSCPLGTIASGSSGSVFFSTVVNSGFAGQIPNQASVTSTVAGTSTAGPSATTNQTVVSVGTVITTGTFELCGPITAFNPATSGANGSITISGVTVVIAAGTTMTNVASGTNECVLANVNGSGQLTTVVGSLNLSGVSAVCGVYSAAATGFVNVAGIPIVVAPGTTFVGSLTAGQSYCFFLNTSGQAIAAVVGIPTRAILPAHQRLLHGLRHIHLLRH